MAATDEVPSDDAELDDYVRAQRRGVARRFAVAGAAVCVLAAVVGLYGRHLNDMQESSSVKFVLPYQLELVGLVGVVVGVLLLGIAGVAAWRPRRRKP
jgi:hypothetical protein